jgi:hypothetical protein
MIEISRRNLITSAAIIFATPAIVKANNIMKVSSHKEYWCIGYDNSIGEDVTSLIITRFNLNDEIIAKRITELTPLLRGELKRERVMWDTIYAHPERFSNGSGTVSDLCDCVSKVDMFKLYENSKLLINI